MNAVVKSNDGRSSGAAAVELINITTAVGSTGGAWPFLVGGLPCQVDSGNERDLSLLTSHSSLDCWPAS